MADSITNASWCRLCIAVSSALLFVAGCGTQDTLPHYAETTLEPGSSLPNLTELPEGGALLSWVQSMGDGTHELRFTRMSEGRDGTALQMGPVEIVASGTDWVVNWADFPSVLQLEDGTLAAHYLRQNARSRFAYDIEVLRGTPDGQGASSTVAWSPPIVPHGDHTNTEHGFATFVGTASGDPGIVWLDGRRMDGGSADDAATELRYKSISANGPDEEELVDNRVCDCCQTDVARLDNGDLVVAYRDRSVDNIRDISVARRHDGAWQSPVRVAQDNWHIDGCPVQGPSIDAVGNVGAVGWFTAAEPPSVKVAFFDETGAFGDPIIVDSVDALGRVSLALLGPDRAAITWLTSDGGSGTTVAEIRLSEVFRNGKIGIQKPVGTTSSTRASGFPQLAQVGNRLVVAWTDVSDEPLVKIRHLSLDDSL